MAERLPFHKQLRYERQLRGWSQEDVASKVGCEPKTVLRWENGKSLPQPFHRLRLCELFGKNAEELGLLEEQATDIDTVSPPSHTSNGPQSASIRPPTQKTSSPTEAENNSSQQPVVYDRHSHWVLTVAWSPAGPSSSPGCDSRVASAGSDATVQIWNANTGQHIRTYRGHAHTGILGKTKFVPTVYKLAWSPDGQRIASAGDGKTVHVWDANTGATIFKYTGHSGLLPSIYALAWSPDGTRIASACSSIGRDKTIHLWDVKTGRTFFHFDARAGLSPSFSVLALAWSPDGTHIASTSGDKKVHVWDAESGRHISAFVTPSNWVRDIAWSPTGKLLAVANGDRTIQIWNTTTEQVIFTYSGHTDSVRAIAWSPAGPSSSPGRGLRIASASNDNTVQLWDAATGNHIFTYRGHTDWTTAVAWSPDGSRIASASNDKTVHVWQATNAGFTPGTPPAREPLST